MAKRKKKQIKKILKQLQKLMKKLPTWLIAFVAGFLVCLLLFFCVKSIKDPEFLDYLNAKLEEAEQTR